MTERHAGPAFVVGLGEVGRRLREALDAAGRDVLPVTRDAGWERCADPQERAARIVCVREEQLAGVLDRLSGVEPSYLVLVQNGFLEAVHGDLGPVTRGLIYFTSKGDFFRVLCASPFHGPLAHGLARALVEGGIEAEVASDDAAYRREMIVKGIWNAVIGLPLAVHQVDLATYLDAHAQELRELTDESAAAAGAAYGVEVSGAEARDKIRATTGDLGWVRGAAKALAWRNGAIAGFGRQHGVPTPVNDRLLRAAGWDPDRAEGRSRDR